MNAAATHVPIVAYHSIADDHGHFVRHLSLPVAYFERQLQHLQRHGFTTVTLDEVYRFLRHEADLPAKSIALTFDDGYLDNWVHALPLLQKYGMKATIFVATDFVDACPRRRPTLGDVWAGRADARDLVWWGHLSWPELEAMHATGLVDMQAHTKTHAWCFTGDRIVDFHHPGDPYFWLDWNQNADAKPGWLTRDFRASVRWGTPVYEFASALLKPRFFDDPFVADAVTDHVADHGGPRFFDGADWRGRLTAVAESCRRTARGVERYESDDQYVARVVDDMAGSKRILEERLNKPVDFLAWPCGDYTPRLQRLAVEACGFRATVNVNKRANRRGDDPRELGRVVFGQDYAGPLREPLMFLNFLGTIHYHSGRTPAYPVAPLARRLMRAGRLVSRDRPAPQPERLL